MHIIVEIYWYEKKKKKIGEGEKNFWNRANNNCCAYRYYR